MNYGESFCMAWDAPIVPSKSLAGIPLGIEFSLLERVLNGYSLGGQRYAFPGSPVLEMESSFDQGGDGGFAFLVENRDLTNWKLFFDSPDHAGADPRALYVIFKNWRVVAIKVWMFEKYKDGGRPVSSYKGRLPGGFKLGDKIASLLSFSSLEFDGTEESFFTDEDYGVVEVGGSGVSLETNPDQVIMSIAVFL